VIGGGGIADRIRIGWRHARWTVRRGLWRSTSIAVGLFLGVVASMSVSSCFGLETVVPFSSVATLIVVAGTPPPSLRSATEHFTTLAHFVTRILTLVSSLGPTPFTPPDNLRFPRHSSLCIRVAAYSLAACLTRRPLTHQLLTLPPVSASATLKPHKPHCSPLTTEATPHFDHRLCQSRSLLPSAIPSAATAIPPRYPTLLSASGEPLRSTLWRARHS